MSYANNSYYVKGQWNAICDVCGFKFKSGQMQKRWDGLMVCKEDWEPDHPQKYLRVREDSQSVPWVRLGDSGNSDGNPGGDASGPFLTSISSGSANAGEPIVHTFTFNQALPYGIIAFFTITGATEGTDYETPVSADLSNGVTVAYEGLALNIPAGISSFTFTINTLENGEEDVEYTLTMGDIEGTGTIQAANPGGPFDGDPTLDMPASDPDQPYVMYLVDYFNQPATSDVAAVQPDVFHRAETYDYTYDSVSLGDGTINIDGSGHLELTADNGNSTSINPTFDVGTLVEINDASIWFRFSDGGGSNINISCGFNAQDLSPTIQAYSWRILITSATTFVSCITNAGAASDSEAIPIGSLINKNLKLVINTDNTQDLYIDGVLTYTFTVTPLGGAPTGQNTAVAPSALIALTTDNNGNLTVDHWGVYGTPPA